MRYLLWKSFFMLTFPHWFFIMPCPHVAMLRVLRVRESLVFFIQVFPRCPQFSRDGRWKGKTVWVWNMFRHVQIEGNVLLSSQSICKQDTNIISTIHHFQECIALSLSAILMCMLYLSALLFCPSTYREVAVISLLDVQGSLIEMIFFLMEKMTVVCF